VPQARGTTAGARPTPACCHPFHPPRLETIVVGVTDVVDITITLRNHGEDSYGTTVQLQHAEALSYRKAVVLQVPPPPPTPPRSFRASKTPRSARHPPAVHLAP